jgi:DNA-binding beta-propeller fold protein YncE
MRPILVTLALTQLCVVLGNSQPVPTPLTQQATIALPGVTGKFDHFAIDLANSRLFAAATGNHSVEVIDLRSGKISESIKDLGKPHGLAWAQETGSLYVSDGTLGELRVYRGSPFRLAGKIKLSEDADDLVYDEAHHLLYVGHGGGVAVPAKVAVVDTSTFTLRTSISVVAHPEGLDLDEPSRRIFANIADAGEVAVIDAATNTVAAQWKLRKAEDNVPMAFDRARHRLFVACRAPATLLELDGATGEELSRAPIGGGVDDLFYDAALRHVYVISGSGEVDALDVNGRSIASLGVVRTQAGAKTGLFVPSTSALYVGVPGTGEKSAEIRVFSTSVKTKEGE